MDRTTETINERRSTVVFTTEEIERRITNAALRDLDISAGHNVKVSVLWPKNPMASFTPQTVTVAIVEDMREHAVTPP